MFRERCKGFQGWYLIEEKTSKGAPRGIQKGKDAEEMGFRGKKEFLSGSLVPGAFQVKKERRVF